MTNGRLQSTRRLGLAGLMALIALAGAMVGCGLFTPEPTPTPIPTLTATSTSTSTPPPTHTNPSAFKRLPTPMTELTTEAGTWTAFTSGNEVFDLAFDEEGLLWAAASGGLAAWDIEQGECAKYTPLDNPALSSIRDSVVKVSDEAIWIGTRERGVLRLDRRSGTWQTFTTAHGLASDSISDMAVGEDEDLCSE